MLSSLTPNKASEPSHFMLPPALEDGKDAVASGRTVIAVRDVLSPQTLMATNRFLDKPSGSSFLYSNQGNTLRGINIYKLQEDLDTSVSFDSDGKLTDIQSIENNICDEAKDLTPLVLESFERMASILLWNDIKVPLEPQIICYPLDYNQNIIKSLPWHYDECTLTMAVIISPETQGYSSYHGGKLSFARNVYGDEPLISGLKVMELNDFKFYPETKMDFSYEYNGGFIFDNLHTIHKVNDIFYSGPSGEKVERRLFTVFASPTVEYVQKLPNLVVGNLV